MTETDDYELMDKDFNEFIRRGLEEMEWERKRMKTDAHRQWWDREE